ncbi:UNVERIFIED_CONTAM: Yip1-like protein [Acetivibrio alkalicellulosi]
MLNNIKFPLYVITHPLDGFYTMKYEKKGKMSIAIINIILLWLSYSINRQYAGFTVNKVDPLTLNTLMDLIAVVTLYILWCSANWSVTTLMDGEGKLKDIAMATSYSLTPLIMALIPATIFGNVVADNEEAFYYLIIGVAFTWFLLLMFVGIMTVHNYSLTKTIATFIITGISMLIIIFLILLTFTLIQQIYLFMRSIYIEIIFRA